MITGGDQWVFGYASLMWRPGFDYLQSEPALIYGFHRRLCVYSHLYRGTPEQPGLVAGLLPGGACRGLAFKVSNDDWAGVRDYLDRREMVYGVYRPRWLNAIISGRTHQVYTYTADPGNPQFAGKLPVADCAALVASGHGQGGSGIDYLTNLVSELTDLGFRDQRLEAVLRAATARDGSGRQAG